MANKKKRRTSKKKKSFEQEVIMLVVAVMLATISLIGLLRTGIVGTVISNVIRFMVGTLYGVVLLLGIVVAFMLIFKRSIPTIYSRKVFGVVLLVFAWLITSAIPIESNEIGFAVFDAFISNAKEIYNGTMPATGGLIGNFLYALISMLVARTGTIIVVIAMVLLSLILLVDIEVFKEHWFKLWDAVTVEEAPKDKKQKASKAKKEEPKKDHPKLYNYTWDQNVDDIKPSKPTTILNITSYDEEEYVEPVVEPVIETPKPTVKDATTSLPVINDEVVIEDNTTFDDSITKPYELPKMALLDSKAGKTNSKTNTSNAKENGEKIIEILKQFNIPAELVNISIGPSVTKFEIKPELGIRVSKIASLQDDIKMALAAKDIRIEAPIPGKSAVGIEIPNAESMVVKMHDMLMHIPTNLANKKLLVALGKDISGQPVYGELDKMPHLLVAGATGSGKSVCMNAMITSILMRATPDEVKMVLVDPKRVEFTAYHGLPHLNAPVINDAKEASKALKVVVDMMDGRYELFSEVGVRNIATYNQKVKNNEFNDSRKPLPYVVVIIDELADLMMVAAKDVEASIQRITQLARAAGIHLIVATQRPSVDVITGIIKANIPSRIAFAVSSAVDSRTILDQTGAEKLLGYGDMLYIPMGEPNPMRVQGAYVSDDEVARITEFVKKQGTPHYDEAFTGPRLQSMNEEEGKNGADPMYEECKAFVIETQKASTSLLQRRFGLGYNRAARMIDQLEENGIIGPNNGSKPREVYVKKITKDSEPEE